MSNAHKLATSFSDQLKQETYFKESFEVRKPNAANAFSGMFGSHKLTDKEQREIELILYEYFQPGIKKEEVVADDLKSLLSLTAEIKAINSQSILLHGERIQKAKTLLCDYREGAFTKWMMRTYGNRQRPYCFLGYYEFYQSAPKEIRPLIESAPKKAVYVLASRNGDKNKKLELIQKHGTSSQSDLLLLIKSEFPTSETDKRNYKSGNTSTLTIIERACQKLENRSKSFTSDDQSHLEKIITRLQKLCKDKQSI